MSIDEISKNDQLLQQMMLERDEAAARVENLNQAIEAWVRGKYGESAVSDFRQGTAIKETIIQPKQEAPQVDEIKSSAISRFHGMALPEAVYRALKEVHEESSARMIWNVLEDAGYQSGSKQPEGRVQDALRRRSKSHGDIMRVGWGKWGLPEWYSKEERARIERNVESDPHSGRDKGYHQERMIEGIKRTQANGGHYGGAPKITPAQWECAQKEMKNGETNFAAILRKVTALTPKGQKPMTRTCLERYKGQLANMEEYPEAWANYFRNRPQKLSDQNIVQIDAFKQ